LIDRDGEAEIAHPTDDQIASGSVFVGEGQATDATPRDRAYLGQLIESVQQAIAVDAEG
jgi:hypothetical protein